MARISSRQRTLVTTAQLTACGLGGDAIAYRVQSRRLHPVFHSVYSVGSGELPALALELAALLACGKGTFLSHRSAEFVWRLRKTPPAQVEVSVVGRCCASRKGVRVHRIKGIEKRELRQYEGLWLSAPARAVLEIAAVGTRDELIEAIDAGLAARRSPRVSSTWCWRATGRAAVQPGWRRFWEMRPRWRSRAHARRRLCCG